MNKVEWRAALSLASVYAIRMFGLFLIVPVFALHNDEFQYATSFLAGVAIGIYGLTQACLQIPMGLLSDYIGRKTLIVAGFLLFCIGSITAALAETIYGVILGRAVQGAGAVAAILMALAADLSRAEQRSKVNTVIGGGIGMAFVAALVAAPILHAHIALSGLFWISALLGVVAICIVVYGVPQVPLRDKTTIASQWQRKHIRAALFNAELLRLYLGAFALHAALATSFLTMPKMITERLRLESAEHWIFYLIIMGASLAPIWVAMSWGEKKRRVKELFIAAILILAVSQFSWYFSDSRIAFMLFAWSFFTAFNYLEANLPALLSRRCRVAYRGSCMGVFSTAQFLGIFIGASSGGLLMEWQAVDVIIPSVTMLFVWFLCTLSMDKLATRRA